MKYVLSSAPAFVKLLEVRHAGDHIYMHDAHVYAGLDVSLADPPRSA
jgi:hypothetical protein